MTYPEGTYFRVISTQGLANSGIQFGEIFKVDKEIVDNIVRVNKNGNRFNLVIGVNLKLEHMTEEQITARIEELNGESKNLTNRLKWMKNNKKKVFDFEEYSVDGIVDNLLSIDKKNKNEIVSEVRDLIKDLTNQGGS